ncbi:methylated-DNA--[protein]-cysteine S-methyltransferase [Litorilituus sediminis]|uniref:Methylated-DNA--protein-cysteine methyltransferase n=1 Tax=Litorilituus sediminis TaxID=718192 RepID=A0A4V0ZG94_9GAMM|nr:methylated-DNA--[protein]-cysteine S-methyltransferase [Litorilituus sediminis]QBG36510.1 methylated-DNA--[protein]-cysteine S-methyltransferase [Litorilituus sediminis]
MFIDYLETPLGLMELTANDDGLCQAIFCGDNIKTINANQVTKDSQHQLHEYFAGKRKAFDLPLAPKGTAFQQLVWQQLANIPYGEVYSYGDIAKLVNKPKGSQAVGGANGRNPISIIVPCHRVIGANGSLTGYAGGIERKLWLLNHEGAKLNINDQQQALNLAEVIHTRQSKTEFLV